MKETEQMANATTATARMLTLRGQWVAAAEFAEAAWDDATMAWDDVNAADDELAASQATLHARDMDEAGWAASDAESKAFDAYCDCADIRWHQMVDGLNQR